MASKLKPQNKQMHSRISPNPIKLDVFRCVPVSGSPSNLIRIHFTKKCVQTMWLFIQ